MTKETDRIREAVIEELRKGGVNDREIAHLCWEGYHISEIINLAIRKAQEKDGVLLKKGNGRTYTEILGNNKTQVEIIKKLDNENAHLKAMVKELTKNYNKLIKLVHTALIRQLKPKGGD